MFQARSDTVKRALVALTLSDGTVMTVAVRLPLSGRLGDMLNNPDHFLDVVMAGGEQHYIAKAHVRAAHAIDSPKADEPDLDARTASLAAMDPYAVLKVARDARPEEIRNAYHRMARLYHPDRIASYELPEEIKDYARAMLVRINLAFEQVRR